jgi:hypothetical protein
MRKTENVDERLAAIESAIGIPTRLYKVSEAAKILGYSPGYVRQLVAKGELAAVYLNPSAKHKHARISLFETFEALKS